MSISKRNSEGYFDPTTYHALTAIERGEYRKTHPRRPLVYICSPFAGDIVHNIENACEYCKFAVKQGVIPFVPHLLYPQFMDDSDKNQRALGLFFGMVWLRKCDALWFFGDHISEGMKKEIRAARQNGLLIKKFNEKMEEISL